MEKITLEELTKLFEEGHGNWTGDNAFQGLLIIAKYIDPMKHDIVCGAEHDEMFSVSGEDLINAGLTKEDAHKLNKLNWSYNEQEDCLSCFV